MKFCNVKTLTGETCRSFLTVNGFNEKVCINGHRPQGFQETSLDFLERDHSHMSYDITKGFFGNMWNKEKGTPHSNYNSSVWANNWIFEIDKGMQTLTYDEMCDVLDLGFQNCDIRKRWTKKSTEDFKIVHAGIPVLKEFFEKATDNDGDIRSKINITPEQIYTDKGISEINRNLIVKYLYDNMDEIQPGDLRKVHNAHKNRHYWFEHKIVNRILKVYVVSYAKNYVKPTLPDDLVSIPFAQTFLKINDNKLIHNWASKGKIFSTYVHKSKLKENLFDKENEIISKIRYYNHPRAVSIKEIAEKYQTHCEKLQEMVAV